MKSIFDKLEKVILVILALSIALMSFVIFLQVIMRIFKTALPWAEELARYLFVWMAMLGASIASRRGSHLSVDVLLEKLPKKYSRVLLTVITLLIIFLMSIAFIYGIQITSITFKQLSAAMQIPMGFVYSAIPVGSALIILFTIENYFNRINESTENQKEINHSMEV